MVDRKKQPDPLLGAWELLAYYNLRAELDELRLRQSVRRMLAPWIQTTNQKETK